MSEQPAFRWSEGQIVRLLEDQGHAHPLLVQPLTFDVAQYDFVDDGEPITLPLHGPFPRCRHATVEEALDCFTRHTTPTEEGT